MTQRARIRRGAQPRRPQPAIARRGVAATRKSASRALATIPVPADRMKRWGRGLAAVLAGAALIAAVFALRLPQMAGEGIGQAIGAMGFSVKRVEIQGIHHMDRLPVYSVALDQTSTAMPLVDLGEIRRKLLRFGWVEDARVSRRLPDTLLVDIVERQPAAIWQDGGRLSLIDKTGVVLAPVDPKSMPDLPILVGADANKQEAGLAALIAAAPRLKPMIAAAAWIGGRRWDIHFQSGETLALPEGEEAARAAFAKFDRMDQAARLLGQGFVRFDMRLPGKVVVRVSKEPGHEIGDVQPPPNPAPVGTDAI
ncbi:MAG TPA: cell division protein FtsQ/DivIB [Sphingomonas sp.]|nr:cell division protein FtsQ/DivIB [Sphingomonas sp.]